MIYRPPYYGHYGNHHGYYGRNSYAAVNHLYNNNNLYRGRQGVLPREYQPHVVSDQEGNIYRRDNQGNWQQRDGRNWKPIDNARQPQTIQKLNRQEQLRDRGTIRTQNFQMSRGGFGGVLRAAGRRR